MRGRLPRPAGAMSRVRRVSDRASERREELKAVWQQASTCQRCPQLAVHAQHRRLRLRQRRRRPDVRRRGARRPRGRARPAVRRPGRPPARHAARARSASPAATSSSPTSSSAGPPGNRDPLPQEIDNCQDYLFRQLELIEPKVICTLGNFSTKLLRGEPTGITRLHGREEIRTIGPRTLRLYPIYHPAAALYTPQDARDAARRTSPGCPSCWRSTRRRSPSRRRPSRRCPSRSW